MPVRSSLCTYSPSSAGLAWSPSGAGSAGSAKYSSILPATSSLSYGRYKPLGSSGLSSSGLSSSASSSSASPSSTTSFRSSYKSPLSSSKYHEPTSNSISIGPSLGRGSFNRYSGSSGSVASGAYSSGSSLTCSSSSSSASASPLSSAGYVPRSRRCSYTWLLPLLQRLPLPLGGPRCFHNATNHHESVATDYLPPPPPVPPHTRHQINANGDVQVASAARLSSGAAGEPHTGASTPAGLINLGNTCYMNATLQALYAIEPFRELVLSRGLGLGGGKVLTEQLADLFRLLKNAAGPSPQPVSPADFKYAFSRYQSIFCGFNQQDAQEFLRYLINGVHEEWNRARQRGAHKRPSLSISSSSSISSLSSAASSSPTAQRRAPSTSQEAWLQYRELVDDSPLVDLLVGQLCSTITCTQCNNKSLCWDPFWDLSLPLSMGRAPGRFSYSSLSGGGSSSLAELLVEFTSKETLDFDERPMCSQCNRPTRSTKQISWSRLPQLLILHLKKFTNDGYKLSSPEIEINQQLAFNSSTYHLRACISHHGHSSCSGHYTSHCKYSNRWFHFNDEQVRNVTSTFNSHQLDDAYVLLYTPQRPAAVSSLVNSQSKL